MIPPHVMAVQVDVVDPYQTSLQYSGLTVAPSRVGAPVELAFTVDHHGGVFLGFFAGTGAFSGAITDTSGNVVAVTNDVNVSLRYGAFTEVRLYTPPLAAQYAGRTLVAYAGPSAVLGPLSAGQVFSGVSNLLSTSFTVSSYVSSGAGASASSGATSGASGSGAATTSTVGTPTTKILGIPSSYVIGGGILVAGGLGAWIVLHRPAPSSQAIRARADARAVVMDARSRARDAAAARRERAGGRTEHYPAPEVLTADGAPISSGRTIGRHARRREAAGVMT